MFSILQLTLNARSADQLKNKVDQEVNFDENGANKVELGSPDEALHGKYDDVGFVVMADKPLTTGLYRFHQDNIFKTIYILDIH